MTINPKLTAIARKLDTANECARRLEALQHEDDDVLEREEKERGCAEAYDEMAKLEWRLAKIPATNIEELALKAKYGNVESYYDDETEWPDPGGLAITAAIIADLLALGREGLKVSEYNPGAGKHDVMLKTLRRRHGPVPRRHDRQPWRQGGARGPGPRPCQCGGRNARRFKLGPKLG